MSMCRLDGKVALVTGASRNPSSGRAIALRLAREGADVAVNGRPRSSDTFTAAEKRMGWQGLDSVVREIKALGKRGLAVPGDVGSPQDVPLVVERVVAHFGHIDILVNNAAIIPAAPLLELDERAWDECLRSNLVGPFLCAREAAKRMIQQGNGGKIVNISSRAGKLGIPRLGAYSASKFGLNGLTQVMALEWGVHRINVNAICLGPIADSGADRPGAYRPLTGEEEHRAARQKGLQDDADASALRTVADQEDLGSLVVFLAAAASDRMTGQTINLTAGEYM